VDPLTITWTAISLAAFLLGHAGVLKPLLKPLLPGPTPQPPALPTSIGRGQLLQYLQQVLANALAAIPADPSMPAAPLSVVPAPAPAQPTSPIDAHQILAQILALIEAARGPASSQPTAPPKPSSAS
jgi:hypothetical protein